MFMYVCSCLSYIVSYKRFVAFIRWSSNSSSPYTHKHTPIYCRTSIFTVKCHLVERKIFLAQFSDKMGYFIKPFIKINLFCIEHTLQTTWNHAQITYGVGGESKKETKWRWKIKLCEVNERGWGWRLSTIKRNSAIENTITDSSNNLV